mgnify:FL=1
MGDRRQKMLTDFRIVYNMTTIIKNTEMTKNQKETAFSLLGSYIKLNPSIVVTVDLHDTYNKQVIIKAKFNGLVLSLIIGAKGKLIKHSWDN